MKEASRSIASLCLTRLLSCDRRQKDTQGRSRLLLVKIKKKILNNIELVTCYSIKSGFLIFFFVLYFEFLFDPIQLTCLRSFADDVSLTIWRFSLPPLLQQLIFINFINWVTSIFFWEKR